MTKVFSFIAQVFSSISSRMDKESTKWQSKQIAINEACCTDAELSSLYCESWDLDGFYLEGLISTTEYEREESRICAAIKARKSKIYADALAA